MYCADVEIQTQELPEKLLLTSGAEAKSRVKPVKVPSELDWLLPGILISYKEAGTPSNSGQVNPYAFTMTLAELAE